MPKTRPLSESFRDSVKKTLLELCDQEKGTKTTISQLCNCSTSLVTKWCSFDTDTLPNFEDLYKIADHYNLTVDWFLTNHEDFSLWSRINTYSEAFRALVPLAERALIKIKDIDNIILNYLLQKYMDCYCSGITDKELTGWCRKILKDFNIPIYAEGSDKEICKTIIGTEEGVKSIDDDVTYLNLAHALEDRELVERIESMLAPIEIPEDAIIYGGPQEKEEIQD